MARNRRPACRHAVQAYSDAIKRDDFCIRRGLDEGWELFFSMKVPFIDLKVPLFEERHQGWIAAA
jgi:hypothetical protein